MGGIRSFSHDEGGRGFEVVLTWDHGSLKFNDRSLIYFFFRISYFYIRKYQSAQSCRDETPFELYSWIQPIWVPKNSPSSAGMNSGH